MELIHIPCIVQEIQTYEVESIFLNHAVYIHPRTGRDERKGKTQETMERAGDR
jgi:hypothetical protein